MITKCIFSSHCYLMAGLNEVIGTGLVKAHLDSKARCRCAIVCHSLLRLSSNINEVAWTAYKQDQERNSRKQFVVSCGYLFTRYLYHRSKASQAARLKSFVTTASKYLDKVKVLLVLLHILDNKVRPVNFDCV